MVSIGQKLKISVVETYNSEQKNKDSNHIKKSNCGSYSNCLSSDPVDCLSWRLIYRNYRFKDNFGAIMNPEFHKLNDFTFNYENGVLTNNKVVYLD